MSVGERSTGEPLPKDTLRINNVEETDEFVVNGDLRLATSDQDARGPEKIQTKPLTPPQRRPKDPRRGQPSAEG